MNKKGVSMIQLIITIILIIIIASIAILNSKNATPEATLARAYASLKEVKTACEEALNLMEINDSYKEENIFGAKFTGTEKLNYYERIGLGEVDKLSDRTYLITKDTQNAQNLELDNLVNEYIVDLENKKYYIVDGVFRNDGKYLYEYRDIQKAYSVLGE